MNKFKITYHDFTTVLSQRLPARQKRNINTTQRGRNTGLFYLKKKQNLTF
jgi:hypothetical protein